MVAKEAQDRDWVLGWAAILMRDGLEIDAFDTAIFVSWLRLQESCGTPETYKLRNLLGVHEFGSLLVIVPIHLHTIDRMVPIFEPDCNPCQNHHIFT
jgi:hypothetical protein